jgi:hypothetical protein
MKLKAIDFISVQGRRSSMRRSHKEVVTMATQNRIMQNGYRESLGMEDGGISSEVAEEWTRGRPQSNRKFGKPSV